MGNSSYFTNLLTNIELSKTTKSYVSSLQSNLRDYLKNQIEYKTKHIDTFLSGSYAKNTSIRVNGGIKMLFYGGLKMLFFGGNKCLLLADRFFI